MISIELETYVNLHLRQALKSDDPYEYTNKLDPKLDGVQISDAGKNLIKTICSNHEILELIMSSRSRDSELVVLSNTIMNKASSIATAIDAKDYDTDADCCPTYWSLFKRLI
jgi:hypothetical protein